MVYLAEKGESRTMTANSLQFMSLWAINDRLDLEKLKDQLDELRLSGLDGVVFHPRYYPNEPEYMGELYLQVLSELILYAKSRGMVFWIYDENGWPSGTASGKVIAGLPDSRCKWVEWVTSPDGRGEIAFGSKSAVSSLDTEAVALFIELTHEAYRQGLKPEAFDYVTGFFADEVAFLDGHGITVKTGAISWDDSLPQRYEAKFGQELLTKLPLLFTEGAGFEQVRAQYWELLTDLLVESFYKPIKDWCAAHGKKFTAHLKGEEHPYFQVSYSGSCFQVLQSVETPAVDALERFPGNHFYPRIAHSIAVQQGREHVLVEAMGGSGWGITPESFQNYILWLAGHGIDLFVLHLNQFKLKTEAVHDWPPSMPAHLTWKAAFPSLLESIKSKAALLPDLRAEPDLLIVTPTRGIMASFDSYASMQMNEHDGSNYPVDASGQINQIFMHFIQEIYEAGVHYELTEERVLEEIGVIQPGVLWIGVRAYKRVLVAEGCRWNNADILQKLSAAGIEVLTPAQWRMEQSEITESKLDTAFQPVTVLPDQTPWEVELPLFNQLFVEFNTNASGLLEAEWELVQPEGIETLYLVLLDPVKAVIVDGQKLTMNQEKDTCVVYIPKANFEGMMKLQIEVETLEGGEPCPVAFVRGSFLVGSRSGYQSKDERQWETKGPFFLSPIQKPDVLNFISSGFPFSGEAIQVFKQVEFKQKTASLQLSGIQAAAVSLQVDDGEVNWSWGPDWTFGLNNEIAAGWHEIRMSLYPSTYNVYGPHRHRDGDRHLVSPVQYQGIKNFADWPDAPEVTQGDKWHFVKWGFGGSILRVQF